MTAHTLADEHDDMMTSLTTEAMERVAWKFYRQADLTRQITVNNPEDREALESWAKHLERKGSQIFGKLQREADRQARELEDRENRW